MLLMLLLGTWEMVSEKPGISVERRALADADYYELRVRTHCDCSPQRLFDVVWNIADYPKWAKYSKYARVLQDKGNERIVYQQNQVPVVKDRDYTVRSWYERDTTSGLIQVWWKQANELGPPETADHVRIKRTGGSWTFEPARGGTDITYVIASEAGGNVPGWIVRGAQTDAAPEFVQLVMERAKK